MLALYNPDNALRPVERLLINLPLDFVQLAKHIFL